MTSYRGGYGRASFVARCREMRRGATDAEAILWQMLRNRQLYGAKFRRQHQFGPYVLDFYCADLHLVIEVDGGYHAEQEQAEYDAIRSDELKSAGVTVVRFTNGDVLGDADAVAGHLWDLVVGVATGEGAPEPSP